MTTDPYERACVFCLKDTCRQFYVNSLGMNVRICDACTELRRAGKLTREDLKERVAELREMELMK